jgi:hypothetical protein
MPNTFTYYELKNATSDFNRDNKLGEGGFGPVYKVNEYFDVFVCIRNYDKALLKKKSNIPSYLNNKHVN